MDNVNKSEWRRLRTMPEKLNVQRFGTAHQLPVQMKVILDLYSDDGVVVFEVETDVAISEKCVW